MPGCPSQTQLDDDSSGLRKRPQLPFPSAGLGLRFIPLSPPRRHVLPEGYHVAGELPMHLLPSSQWVCLRLFGAKASVGALLELRPLLVLFC